jgi:hypothetical protein
MHFRKLFSLILFSFATVVYPQHPAEMSVADLDDSTGITITGLNGGDWFGFDVGHAGDVNSDGFVDFMISAIKRDTVNGIESGATYVIFGREDLSSGSIDLESLDGTNGFRIDGENGEDEFGFSLAMVGDINDDGVTDLAITASDAESDGLVDNGITYIIFGDRTFPAVLDLSALDGRLGFRINGRFAGDRASSVAPAGDFNADGIDDLIIGTQAFDPQMDNAGAAYVFFGKPLFDFAEYDLGDIDPNTGIAFHGEHAHDIAGHVVRYAGDFNNDGIDDVLISSKNHDPNSEYRGAVYIVFGSPNRRPAIIPLSSIDGTDGIKIVGDEQFDELGLSADYLGDINDDGYGDLAISTLRNANQLTTHKVNVIFGSDSTPASGQTIDSIAQLIIHTPPEVRTGSYRYEVSSAGDLNGDGIPDIAIGDPDYSDHRTKPGAVHVLFGSRDLTGVIDLTTPQPSQGFRLTGSSWHVSLGTAIDGTGDVNGDGVDDLLLGNYSEDEVPGGAQMGASNIIFGNDTIMSSQFE